MKANALSLARRWSTPEGQALAIEVTQWLVGEVDRPPEGVGDVDGRVDLRGFGFPGPRALRHVDSFRLRVNDVGVVSLYGVAWRGLDLSHARLPSLAIFDGSIVDCIAVGANLEQLGLWGSTVADSSFVRCEMRRSVLGGGYAEKANRWSGVTFEWCDLRHSRFTGAMVEDCRFANCKFTGMETRQATWRSCSFRGLVQRVLFDNRDLSDRPPSVPFTAVDFSESTLDQVDFAGCRFEQVTFPAGITTFENFPEVARRACEVLSGIDTPEARGLHAILGRELRAPGRPDTVGVINHRDYVAIGGEAMADLADRVLAEAAADQADDMK